MQKEKSGTRPRISVILTVYKRTEYLGGALDSVLAQSFSDYEVIVADDSGTAAAREIVASRARVDQRVHYRANPATVGIVLSLVGTVKEARGDFIAILNDDDYWEMDFLSELVGPLIADASCVAAFADHWVMDETGRIDIAQSNTWSANTSRSTLPAGPVREQAEFTIAKAGIPVATSAMFRKNAVDWSLVVPEVSGAYDYWISCLLGASGRPIYYVPKRLARYRVHAAMESLRRSHDKAENLVYIFTKLRQQNWFPEMDTVIRAKLAEALLLAARDKLHFGHFQASRRLFCRSFLLDFRPMALAGAIGTFIPGTLRKKLWTFIRAVGARLNQKSAGRSVRPR